MDYQQATLDKFQFYLFYVKQNMINNNPNKKGTLGEIAVCKELIQLGYEVFVELGNHSKIDLIVLDENYRTFKVQIKTTKSTNDVVEVYSVKNFLNPKYNSTYSIKQVDIFAVYICDKDIVFYVSAKEILRNGKSSKFRLSDSKNGQKKFVPYIKDYLNFKKALRDCTPYVQTVSAVDDETVQTTTSNFSVAGESQCGK